MPALFPSLFADAVFVVVYFLFYFLEIINQTFIALKHRRSVIKTKNDRLSLFGIYFCSAMILYVAGAFGWLRMTANFCALPVWTFYLGIIIMISGEALRQWSTYTLGRLFTAPVVIFKGHELVARGPYRTVRHPGYLGGLIVALGIGVAVQSWVAPFACVAVLAASYSYRIYLEEKALRKEFGDAYAKYSRSTPMIIPRLV